MDREQLMLKKDDHTTTKKTGTGLGLPIVTKIINEHNGNFSIKTIKIKNY